MTATSERGARRATRMTRAIWLMLNATTNRTGGERCERHVVGERGEQHQHQQDRRRVRECRRQGCCRRAGCSWRSARWRRWPRTRRTARRRGWRCPGRPAPDSGRAWCRAFRRRRSPRAATRWRPEGPPRRLAAAAPRRCRTSRCGSVNGGSPRGIPPKAEPIVATPAGCVRVDEHGRRDECHHRGGNLAHEGNLRPQRDDEQAGDTQGGRGRLQVGEGREQLRQPLEEGRARCRGQTEEVPPLTHEDDDRDAGREAEHHGFRDEADDAAELGQPEQQQHRASEQRHDLESDQPVLRGDAKEQHRESARRPRNLNARPAKQRYEQPRDERCVESLLRLSAGCDRERHGER